MRSHFGPDSMYALALEHGANKIRARAGKETPMSERNPTPRMVADAFESGHARGLADAITRCTALANELGGVWQTVLASFVRAIRRRGEGGS
jgi:hypothetical protein